MAMHEPDRSLQPRDHQIMYDRKAQVTEEGGKGRDEVKPFDVYHRKWDSFEANRESRIESNRISLSQDHYARRFPKESV